MPFHDQDPRFSPGRDDSDEARAANSARAERLARIRQMIDDGTYETTERLEGAVSRFLSAVGEHA